MAPPVYGEMSLKFDQRGNLVSRGGFSFHYNSLNQLVQVDTPDGGRWFFVYDGLGRRRITKHLDSRGTIIKHIRHLYFGRLRIEDQDLMTGEFVRYVRGQDLSGTMEDAGGAEGLQWAVFSSRPMAPFYYLHDGRGNCTGLLGTGSEDWDARYAQTALGIPLVDQQSGLPAPQPFRMQGKAWIEELGLYDFGARFYDPFLARWLTPDPEMEKAGWNLYEPFQGDPVEHLDPWGRDIFVMIDEDAVLRQGHVAVTIGQPQEAYQYFSFEKGCSVLTVKDNLEGLFFPSLQSAVEGLPRYDRYMVYKCPPDQDRAAVRAAMQWMNSRYNLFNHNCKDFVRHVLSAIGKDTQNAWQPILFMDKNQPRTLVPSHSGSWDWNEMQGKRYLFMPWNDYFDEFENDSIRPALVPPMRAN
jgi:RHS repeat-associated protein